MAKGITIIKVETETSRDSIFSVHNRVTEPGGICKRARAGIDVAIILPSTAADNAAVVHPGNVFAESLIDT